MRFSVNLVLNKERKKMRYINVNMKYVSMYTKLFENKVKILVFIGKYKSTYDSREVFHLRILRYFRENKHFVTCVKPELTAHSWELGPQNIKLDLDKIKTLSFPDEFINYVLSIGHISNWSRSVLCIDSLLSKHDHFSIEDTFRLLDVLIYIIPNITKLKFYLHSINQFERWLKNNHSWNPFYLIHVLFFVSLSHLSPHNRNIMQDALNEIDKNVELLKPLSVEDISILTNCFYRTSVRINSEKILYFIVNTVEINLKQLLQDGALLIALLKPLKSVKYQDRKLLGVISQEILANNYIEHFSLMAKTHLISLYNDSLYHDINIIKLFVTSMEYDIIHMKIKDIRIKDICTLLWTLSYVGLNIANKSSVKDVVTNKIEYVINDEVLSYKLRKDIISIVLSMWILKWDIEDMIKVYITNKPYEFWEVKGDKDIMNFHLLHTCLSIEAPHLIRQCLSEEENICLGPNINKRLSMRFFLQKVLRVINNLAPVLHLQHVECVYNVPYIWICAISVFNQERQLTYVEVLDNSTCLRGTNIPNGLMELKLRLLRKMKHKYILIDYMDPNYEEVENLFKAIENGLKC